MAKEQKWTVSLEDGEHEVTLVQDGLRSNAVTLFIDEEEGSFFWPRDGYLDEPITIGGKECRLCMRNYLTDLVIDGTFLSSGKPYVPIEEIPRGYRFFLLGALIFFFLLCRHRIWISLVGCIALWLVSDRISHQPGGDLKKRETAYLLISILAIVLAVILRIILH